jgi:hypothetical protein
MMAVTIKHFDVLSYIKKAKEYGIREEFAELNARQIEKLTDTVQEQQIKLDAMEALAPSTKKDLDIVKLELKKDLDIVKLELKKDLDIVKLELQKEIAEIKNSLVKWVITTGVSAVVVLSGMMFTMLKFMLH